uniref:Class II aldolase/adducin N-terminal domain-containing protein n=1 Tax=Parascaris univalens TaxID=6257 RepID=A0A915BBA0_PARUN
MVHYVGLAGGIRLCAVGTPICCVLAMFLIAAPMHWKGWIAPSCAAVVFAAVSSCPFFASGCIRFAFVIVAFAVVVLYGFFDCVLPFQVKFVLFLSRYRSAVCLALRMHPASLLSWFILQ